MERELENASTPTAIDSDASRASPHTLPNEILVEIMCYHQARPSRNQLMWIWVTHVCRHWRVVALSTPLLWTRIIFTEYTKPAAVATFLERSGDAPLSVISDIHRSRPHCTLCVLFESVVRDHAGRISRYVGCDRTVAGVSKGAVFSVLEHMDISADGEELLELNLDCGWFPSLRSLRLDGMKLPSTFHISHSIVHLQLSRIYGDFTRDSLLDLLEPLVLLEDLTIQGYRYLYTDDQADDQRVVSLNRLCHLDLGYAPLSLISHLTFPASTSVHKIVSLPDPRESDVEGPFIITPKHIGPLSQLLAPIERVSLDLSGFGFDLVAHVRVPSLDRSFIRLQLHTRCHDVSGGRWPLLPELSRILAFSSVTDLKLSGDRPGQLAHNNIIETLFPGCPRLRHLSISYAIAVPLGEAVQQYMALSPHGHVPRFPELETLTFVPDPGLEVASKGFRQTVVYCLLWLLKCCRLRGSVLERATIQTANDVMEWDADERMKEVRQNVGVLRFEKPQPRTHPSQTRVRLHQQCHDGMNRG